MDERQVGDDGEWAPLSRHLGLASTTTLGRDEGAQVSVSKIDKKHVQIRFT